MTFDIKLALFSIPFNLASLGSLSEVCRCNKGLTTTNKKKCHTTNIENGHSIAIIMYT